MPRIKKKGTSGAAKNYITRTQAVRKLQISLPDFRRLCIFKGIYPREPRSKKKIKGSTPSTTFYYSKDIQYLLHEPLLQKFRDHKSLAKKISRALGRGNAQDAARLEKLHTPKMHVDHIIRERYPTFEDALSDLDDALSMLYLFSNLPSTTEVPAATVMLCQRLCREFELYLIRSHALRKSFLSIKGIYYQASIQGVDVMWIVPYRFVQRVSHDIDFRIMATFVDFYTNLIGFVNFRLYSSIGLIYPPKFSASSDANGGELGAYSLELTNVPGRKMILAAPEQARINPKAQALADALAADAESEDEDAVQDDSKNQQTSTEGEVAESDAQEDTSLGLLFADLSIWISRETPRQPLELLLRAFGCKRIGWEASLGDGAFRNDEDWSGWTHHILDRPVPAGGQQKRMPGRVYIQPQWVWDAVNAVRLPNADLYASGAALPPHLSPWVKLRDGEYDPTKPLPGSQQEGVETDLSEDESDESDEDEEEDKHDTNGKVSKVRDSKLLKSTAENDSDDDEVEPGEGMNVDGNDDDGDEDVNGDDDPMGDDDEIVESSEDEDEVAHRAELAAEAAGRPAPSGTKDSKSESRRRRETTERNKSKADRDAAEELARRKGMMSNKKRKLFEMMEKRQKKQTAETDKLIEKRRRLEKEKKKQLKRKV